MQCGQFGVVFLSFFLFFAFYEVNLVSDREITDNTMFVSIVCEICHICSFQKIPKEKSIKILKLTLNENFSLKMLSSRSPSIYNIYYFIHFHKRKIYKFIFIRKSKRKYSSQKHSRK